MPSAELGRRGFGRPLTRRRALLRGGAALAAFGAGAARWHSSPLLAQEASPVADEPAAADAPGMVNPARVARAVERLPAMVEEILERSGDPGLFVAIVYDDEVVFSGGFGVREVGIEAAVDAETVFLLASVSKTIAATVVSSVVGDGVISWDAKMADLAPGFALHDDWPTRNVTLADLFAHRSGLAVNNVPEDPARQRTGFYGLGLNVSVTDFGAVQWGHSGAFSLGAATAVYMLPGSGCWHSPTVLAPAPPTRSA